MYDISNKGNMKVFPFCVQALSSTGVKRVDLIDDADETAIKVSSNPHQLIMNNGLDINGLIALSADNTKRQCR
ncbi:unnamed protein product [Rotaria sp. Silwood2]|nr:unnamed protein product [Rotaria sp. Silwood2]CAF3422528.1 unnamed protein product [Rotaria sp. Silwood2]CAF4418759.1 unnamed protein product [Rotaria sp. Silwood2]